MKPIIFSTEMAQAILAERKTQTRRVIKGVSTEWDCFGRCTDGDSPFIGFGRGERLEKKVKAPYQPGDILWVRETWTPCATIGSWLKNETIYAYKADYSDKNVPWKWWPSIHMPKDAARIFLKVTDVRVERVQEILCNDMEKEGVIPPSVKGGQWQLWQADYFRPLWDRLNAKRGYGWDANPYVWVIEFERISNGTGYKRGPRL